MGLPVDEDEPNGTSASESDARQLLQMRWLHHRRRQEETMTRLVKGSVTIAVDAWLKAQHPHSAVTPDRYLELYLAELQREGWKVVSS
jgi:hypothetical protein